MFASAAAVPSLSHVPLFATPWPAAHQPSLFFTISQSLRKFMSIELVWHLLLFRNFKTWWGRPWKAKQNMSEGKPGPEVTIYDFWFTLGSHHSCVQQSMQGGGTSQLFPGSLLNTSLTAAHPDVSWQCQDFPQSTSRTSTCGHCK